MNRNTKNPERRLGTARNRRTIVPRTGYPITFSQKLPAMMAANATRMMSHIPMLNVDTDPSVRPRKKKNTMMVQISRSRPQNIQNIRSLTISITE